MSTSKKVPMKGARPIPTPRKDPLASLRMAQFVTLKPVLPAEILETILDFLSVSDLIRCARVSKRMQEMVFEESRWIQRLKRIGCWNEVEARRRIGGKTAEATEHNTPRGDSQTSLNGHAQFSRPNRNSSIGPPMPEKAALSQRKRGASIKVAAPSHVPLEDGFDAIKLSSPSTAGKPTNNDTELALHILDNVRSDRVHARQEYGKVYKALAPFYNDIILSTSDYDLRVFKSFTSPPHRAQMLSQLGSFAKSDPARARMTSAARLEEVLSRFESAALQEFRRGYEDKDIDGRMRQYAHVLHILNGGKACTEAFVRHNHLVTDKAKFGNPGDCLDYSSGHGTVSLERTQAFFNQLTLAYSEEISIVDRAFPPSANAIVPIIEKLGKEVLSPYLTSLYDEAHSRGLDTYLRTVSGTFAQTLQFAHNLQPSQASSDDFYDAVDRMVIVVFEAHLDLYLAEELDFFKRKSNAHIDEWDRALSEQAASTETFFMGKFNRQADKKDFLTSFKKVVMMPVNILPSFPTLSTNKATAKALVNGESQEAGHGVGSQVQSRVPSPTPWGNVSSTQARLSTSQTEAPANELAAKAALMNSKLEGIRSLFSIEVALDLVHWAKESLERVALFAKLSAPYGTAAQRQCEAIFVYLLHILGVRHVKEGFDKAVSHLSHYNPREDSKHSQPGVQPLVTFLELVNVGDLIQQMLDVFYEQELIATRLTDRSDFLDPAVKEKKKFEQMLDERVAAGLNKGIDVLMDEAEYVCATTQLPTDFNPVTETIDIGPSDTAQRVVEIVSSHTDMLVGSTDKSLLDVFNQEVGLRLFTALCKHLKRQRISTTGSIKLISDMNHYFQYISRLKNPDLLLYFTALRELSQIYLIDPRDAKELAHVIADGDRFHGIFRAEEVYEFAERRADWYQVKARVEKAMYGAGCCVM